MATAKEQEALNEVMQLLEAAPDTAGQRHPSQTREAGHPCFDWQVQRSHRCAAHT